MLALIYSTYALDNQLSYLLARQEVLRGPGVGRE
jgi:hypothetical protein